MGGGRNGIIVSKLVTDFGKKNGTGDMIELIKLLSDKDENVVLNHPIYIIGTAHVAFGVSEIDDTVNAIISNGGSKETEIGIINKTNKLCFCRDPEGNWLELIQKVME